MAQLDRRVVRTRTLLRDALMALILEQGYDSVTVQEITDRANLGRATFYLHYKDKEELLVKSLQAVYDELIAQMDPPRPEMGAYAPALLAFRHAGEHSDLYRVLLSGQGSTVLYRRVREHMADVITRRFAPLPAPAALPDGLLPNYLAGSLLALIAWWLESGMPATPEEMAQIFRRLLFLGLADVVGLDRGLIAAG